MGDMLRHFFGIGSEAHRQVYRSIREYPIAIGHTLFIGFCFGFVVGYVLS